MKVLWEGLPAHGIMFCREVLFSRENERILTYPGHLFLLLLLSVFVLFIKLYMSFLCVILYCVIL